MPRISPAVGRTFADHMATNHRQDIMATTDTPLTDREISMAHTIDDVETRRAHMHRMLVDQRFLLAGALDAIRAGDNHVATEFVDRFLTHVDTEITYQLAWRDGR